MISKNGIVKKLCEGVREECIINHKVVGIAPAE